MLLLSSLYNVNKVKLPKKFISKHSHSSSNFIRNRTTPDFQRQNEKGVTCKIIWILFLFAFMVSNASVNGQSSGLIQPQAIADTVYTLKDIVVTAQRFAENSQTVPMSVKVFDNEQLKVAAVNTLQDLTTKSPNVNIFASRSSLSTSAIFIRGIGQEDNVFTVDPGVGVYLDDILIPRAQGGILDLYDVERIEILRGPQGTLYGRNTIAGTIKYYSKQPTNDFTKEIEMTYGSYNRRDLKGIFNIPIVSGELISRIAFGTFNREGFEYNVYNGKRTDSKKSLVGRATLLWLPNQNFEFEFKADGIRERPSIHVGSLIRPQTTALDYNGLVNKQFVTIPVPDDPFTVRSDVKDQFYVDTWGLSGTANWVNGNSFSIKALASYRKLDEDSHFDFDATEARAADVFIKHHHNQASGELQLTYDDSQSLKYVGGIFFFHEKDDEFDGTDAMAKGFSLDAIYDQSVYSYAFYSQASYKLTNKLSATLGLRYTIENKTFNRVAEFHPADSTKKDNNLFGGYGNGPGGIAPSQFPGNGIIQTNIKDAYGSWNAFTPHIGLEYQLSRFILTYFNVSRGFKSGGFNGRASEASNPQQRNPYNPEYVWSYELGTKTSWFENRLILNVSAFYNDYRDLQLSSFSETADGNYLPLFTNAGKAFTKGFEIEATSRPINILKLNAGIGFTDSRYLEYREQGRDVSNLRTFPNAPEWTGIVGASLIFPVFESSYILQFGGDLNYQGERYLTVSNLPDLKQPDYVLLNAFIIFKPINDGWQITLNGKNLTNKHYLIAGLDASPSPFGIVSGFYGDPLTLSVTVNYRF